MIHLSNQLLYYRLSYVDMFAMRVTHRPPMKFKSLLFRQKRFEHENFIYSKACLRHGIVVHNTENIPRHRTIKSYGLVTGSAIHAALCYHYTDRHNDVREESIRRMCEQAADAGANAVINVRFTTTMTEDTSEFLSYGTAVKLAEDMP